MYFLFYFLFNVIWVHRQSLSTSIDFAQRRYDIDAYIFNYIFFCLLNVPSNRLKIVYIGANFVHLETGKTVMVASKYFNPFEKKICGWNKCESFFFIGGISRRRNFWKVHYSAAFNEGFLALPFMIARKHQRHVFALPFSLPFL